jgi:hypothetical protein
MSNVQFKEPGFCRSYGGKKAVAGVRGWRQNTRHAHDAALVGAVTLNGASNLYAAHDDDSFQQHGAECQLTGLADVGHWSSPWLLMPLWHFERQVATAISVL